jgi:hypothetical protein
MLKHSIQNLLHSQILRFGSLSIISKAQTSLKIREIHIFLSSYILSFGKRKSCSSTCIQCMSNLNSLRDVFMLFTYTCIYICLMTPNERMFNSVGYKDHCHI